MPQRVLIVDDDFRVAEIHGKYAAAAPGVTVVGIAHTAADAQAQAERTSPDLALVDNYLPDLPGVELTRRLPCDVFMVTADRSPLTVRAALAAGAVNYVVKPFPGTLLTARISSWVRYRTLLQDNGSELDQSAIDHAIGLLHQADRVTAAKGRSPVTQRLVADLLRDATEPQTAADAATALGISRATAQRYLAALEDTGRAVMTMRYGSTGRPEHLYAWADS